MIFSITAINILFNILIEKTRSSRHPFKSRISPSIALLKSSSQPPRSCLIVSVEGMIAKTVPRYRSKTSTRRMHEWLHTPRGKKKAVRMHEWLSVRACMHASQRVVVKRSAALRFRPVSIYRCAPTCSPAVSFAPTARYYSKPCGAMLMSSVHGSNRGRYLTAVPGSDGWLRTDGPGNVAAVARRNTVAGVVFWSHGTDCSACRGDI
jgi:hypothetical protein